MGGSAFRATLGQSAFPRIPPSVYEPLKGRLYSRISELYTYVSVPKEAPEKEDYGDLDFLVTEPRFQLSKTAEDPSLPGGVSEVPDGLSAAHVLVKRALRAKHVIPWEGNRTSNYAVPVQMGEWEPFGYGQLEMQRRSEATASEIFYQVDIHVCKDKEEWSRIDFFHSYGDMGMMLGLIARNIGLRLGETGLKLPISGNPPLLLSSSFDEILPFLGLSRGPYDSGFKTKEEVFRWVASQRFFDPRFFRASGPGITKVNPERKMYFQFVDWVQQQQRLLGQSGVSPDSSDNGGASPASSPSSGSERETGSPESDTRPDTATKAHVKEQALIFFNKKAELEARSTAQINRERVRKTFCGHNVRDWIDLGDHWRGVKMVMDEIRKRMGGEEGVLKFLDDLEKTGEPGEGEERLKEIAISVRDELGLLPVSRLEASQKVESSDKADALRKES
ncbi:hypothetical protein NMY22_g15440 [Coprinellus aureogranulatus]|nr:hypothetical protein NMY22_g15440 [Coprinellus aureogranulatus]